jgi:hypothetical protein
MKTQRNIKDESLKEGEKWFEISFKGKTKVRAFTETDAISRIENAIYINPSEKVEVYSFWETFGTHILENIPSIVTIGVYIPFIFAWTNLLNAMQVVPSEFRVIGIMILIVVIVTTMKIPLVIGDLFKINRW